MLIFIVHTDPSYNRPGVPSTVSAGIVNTGTQAISDVKLKMEYYSEGRLVYAADGTPIEVVYDMAGAMPPGGIPVSKALGTGWNIVGALATCLRITGINIDFADGSSKTIIGDELDLYMTPAVNKHCAPDSRIDESDPPFRRP